MPYSSRIPCDQQPDCDAPDCPAPLPEPDRSIADSLKKIVRRVLRTQNCRTSFEVRVLDEARRLLDSCEIARDTLERLVVDRLLGNRREGRMEIAAQGAGAICPPTQMHVSHSTFARHVTGD